MKKRLPLLLVAAMACAAGYWASTALHRSPSLVVSTYVPADDVRGFELSSLDGKSYGLKAWPGTLMLVNFWATWCAPCREEIPLLVDFQERYGSRGLQVVGVAIDNRGNVAEFSDQMRINYPLLIGQDDAITLMTRYGNRVGSLPFSVVIDPDGRIVARKLGIYKQPELEALLIPLLPSA